MSCKDKFPALNDWSLDLNPSKKEALKLDQVNLLIIPGLGKISSLLLIPPVAIIITRKWKLTAQYWSNLKCESMNITTNTDCLPDNYKSITNGY